MSKWTRMTKNVLNSNDDIREKDENHHGRHVRISPSDTIIELRTRKQKQRKSSLSGSGLFKRAKIKNAYQKFQMKECFVYTENEKKFGTCMCGLAKEKHPEGFEINRNTVWSDLCTRRLRTNTYGEINFDEILNTSRPYVRISDDTKAKDLINLMRREWKLELPNLVISVTGGAKSFKLKPRLKEVFSKGLVKVADSTGAWIITGGTDAGVMKHVGEAVKHRGTAGSNAGRSKVNVIGIAPWGVLDNNHTLISKDYEGLYPARYRTNRLNTSKTGLDYNHSCFLLVDNGTTGKYGTEIKLRSTVERAIAQYKTDSMSSKGAIGIPVVILCLEGGPNTIQTMVEAIRSGTPAVVIDGSGRAADVVSYAYKHLVEDTQQFVSINDPHHACIIDPEYVKSVQDKVAEVFGKDNVIEIYHKVEELLRDEKMITVFRLDDEGGKPEMDLAILTSLLKANKASFQMQLKLALAWNRIDVAKSEIFTEDLKKKDFNAEWLFESMFAALIDDKPDFVELFFHEGVNLKQFLTLEILEALYNAIPQHTPIKHVINGYLHLSHEDTPPIDMCVIGHVFKELMGDRFKPRYLTDSCYTGKKDVQKKHSVCFQQNENDVSGKHIELPTPYLDLFTWAVLCNRQRLGQILWEKLEDSIACALMASKLLKSLAEFTTDNKELADMVDDLLDHSRSYELKAIGVLEECRKESDKLAQALLVKNLPNFGGGLTNLDLAVSADNQDFIAHTSCQTIFNRLWMGELYINTELLKVLICIFVPIAIPWMITFQEDIPDVDTSTTIVNPNRVADEDLLDNDFDKSVTGSESSLQNDFPKPMDLESQHNNNKEEEEHKTDEVDCGHESVKILGYKTPTGYLKRVICFHDAPFVKFVVNVISYTFFLLLYSFLVLTRLNLKLHTAEYVLQGWVFTLFCEEIRQLVIQEPKHFLSKVEFYFQDPWNIADCASLLGFIVATVLRYVAEHMNEMDMLSAARIVYSTDIIIFILRLLQIFSVNRHMGPKLVMIRKMLNDLVYFVVILAVFVIGYGVATQAVLYPNSELWDAVVGVLNKPYWQMYGELFADDILETKLNCTTGEPLCGGPGEPCRDKFGKYVAPVYMALYMLFTNILLLNLLIAIFNYTFEKVQEDSDKVWKFQRYDLIQEYRSRPSLCPPFIILAHIFFLFKWILHHYCGCFDYQNKNGQSLEMELFLSNFSPEDLVAREYVAAETHGYDSTLRESETQDERVKAILLRVNQLADEIEQIKYNGSEVQPDSLKKEMRPETKHGIRSRGNTFVASQLEPRLNKLEQSVEQILQLMIHQNERQALILEASEKLKSSDKLKIVKSKITSIHMKARISPYPGSTVTRFNVPDEKVTWEAEFSEYQPVIYTAPVVLAKPYWADVDLLSASPPPALKYNVYDEENKVNRISHVGIYDVSDGLPRNPYGRTGMKGRGSLGRFGPNHAADPIATRWKRTSSGILLDRGQRVLEFIAIQRRDNHQWAIPGGMVEPGEHVSETLRKEFTEEALAKLNMSEEKRQLISERITYLFRNGVEVYKGYVDDPRNTDNAWMETVACNFHDDTGEIFGEFQLQAGDDAQAVRWQRVSGNIPLFASHVSILKKVAEMHNAAFY